MSKRYVLFAALPYSYSILRPIQSEIRKRGGEVAWYLEHSCEDLLLADEKRLATVEELVEFNPDATLTPGNYIYHFIPGIKVGVFMATLLVSVANRPIKKIPISAFAVV